MGSRLAGNGMMALCDAQTMNKHIYKHEPNDQVILYTRSQTGAQVVFQYMNKPIKNHAYLVVTALHEMGSRLARNGIRALCDAQTMDKYIWKHEPNDQVILYTRSQTGAQAVYHYMNKPIKNDAY
jgi:hypothetical protein